MNWDKASQIILLYCVNLVGTWMKRRAVEKVGGKTKNERKTVQRRKC